jgi:hypothetical protein
MRIRTQALPAYQQAKHTMAQHQAEVTRAYRESWRTWFLQQMQRVFGLEVCPPPDSDTLRLEDITFTMHGPRHASQTYAGSAASLCIIYPCMDCGTPAILSTRLTDWASLGEALEHPPRQCCAGCEERRESAATAADTLPPLTPLQQLEGVLSVWLTRELETRGIRPTTR